MITVRGAQSPALIWIQSALFGRRDVFPLRNTEVRGVPGRGRELTLHARRVLRMMSSGSANTVGMPCSVRAHLVLIRSVSSSIVMSTSRTFPRLSVRACTRPTPFSDQPPTIALEDWVQVGSETLAAADGNRPVPLRLQRMTHVPLIDHRPPEAETIECRSPLDGVLVIHVRREPLRKPAPQLELQRVVVAISPAVGDVDVVDVGVGDEEVRRQPRGDRPAAGTWRTPSSSASGPRGPRACGVVASGERRVRPVVDTSRIGRRVGGISPAPVRISEVGRQRVGAGTRPEVRNRPSARRNAGGVVRPQVLHRQPELVHEIVA